MNKSPNEQRLEELRQEYAELEMQLRALKARENHLKRTMERIEGAITVLEEILQEAVKNPPYNKQP